jgi:hypothetical protein
MVKLKKDMASKPINNQIHSNIKGFLALNKNEIPVIEIFSTNNPQKKRVLVGTHSLAELQRVINSFN